MKWREVYLCDIAKGLMYLEGDSIIATYTRARLKIKHLPNFYTCFQLPVYLNVDQNDPVSSSFCFLWTGLYFFFLLAANARFL